MPPPTEADWRRNHADPAQLRAQAQELRRRADFLVQGYQALRGQVDRACWEGQAAERFRAEIAEHYAGVQKARRSLEMAAAALQNAASRLEAELERVRYERARWEFLMRQYYRY